MFSSSVRVGLVAALVTLLSGVMAGGALAQKAFQRDDLTDAAIKLEAQIRAESGAVTAPIATLRRDADAAFQRNDFRNGLLILGRITVVAPEDSANWLRIAQAVLQIRPGTVRERTTLLERAATAAYIAYQRTKSPAEEAAALLIVSRSYADRQLWRPALDAMRLSLDLREVADVRQQYERMREDYGFRLLDYSVDADASSPRACFQFSEDLPGRRTDLSPFVAVSGQDRPALTVDARQICVEGLKHGERYTVTLRAGIPSSVRETLAKPAEFNIYVRDRKPVVRFSARAYVLPRVGQRGIPIVSVNTSAVAVEVYRIGDRNLVATVLGHDFQRTLNRYELARLREERGSQVWKGEMQVDPVQNADVTTAFPVSEAIPNLGAGVYVMVARAANEIGGEDYADLATQWFIVSDLGLAAYSGNDGIHTFVHSLETTQGANNVEVRLLSRNNEVLATKRTNNAGYVQFEAALTRGEIGAAPAMLVATDAKGDYAFLSLRSPAFDLSDRGVSGRNAPSGLDGFVFTERGVYRSGENVHVTALLRDAQGTAAVGVPLTLVVERPDGVEYRRTTVADQGVGGRSLEVALVQSAPTGTWRVRAYTDPKRPAVGEATFMVEDYVPDRLEFELSSPAKTVSRTEPAPVTLEGRYLYGAPAAGLEVAGEVIVAPASERAGLAGYRFGLSDEQTEPTRSALDGLPATDSAGRASFPISLEKVPQATRPLEARVTVRLAEPGGRAVERKLTLPVTATGPMIGIKPLFSGRSLGEGEQATFDVVVVGPDGEALTRNGLRYELLKVETRYQWYRRDNAWDFEPMKLTRRIADGQVNVAPGTPGRISMPVQWGRYRLEISTGERDGPVTSIGFDAGWYTEATADAPDMLELALDKPEYSPGDNMTVAVTARTAGKVTLSVIGERLLATVTQDVKPGTARLQLPVGKDWGTGAYVVATLRRPLDAAAQRMPGRAIGVQWFGVNRQARTLAVAMQTPQLTRPGSALRIPVKIGGLAAGEEARIVVAAVDVGILNLTNYKPPAPDDHYLGQRRLAAELRDLYGQLIDGMQGTRGQIRSGGDAAAELHGSPPAQKPLALYSGVVTVKPDGTAEIVFDIPDFAGTARVMAVAWSREKVGRAQSDVVVRDPVVVTATLPRFLNNGDRGSIHLDVDNVDGQAGDYRVEVRSDGVDVTGSAAPQTLRLNAKQRSAVTLPLTAPAVGVGNVTVRVSGPGGFALERSYALTVKPATQILARRTVQTVARGEAVTLSNDLLTDLVPGTGSVSVSVGLSSALDAAALLAALDRYPFGCTEQITSRALPLLYVNDLASASHLALDEGIDKRIQDAIDRLLSRQGSNGSFGLWSVGGDDLWLDAYVTDFLTRARERNFAVPDTAYRLAVQRLKNYVANAEDPGRNGGRKLAYALYVLARNGAAPVGDLRYFVDTKLDDFATTIAKAQLAAALGMLGDKVRAERVYSAALRSMAPQPTLEYGRVDYGSILRDGAALITLASEGGAPRATITGAIERVEAARGLTPYTSTQEQAWMVLAARALVKDATNVALDVAGEKRQGALNRRFLPSQLQKPLRIANAGEGPLQAVVTVNGAPLTPEPAADRGFKIERLYFTLDGKPADPAKAKQNDRFAVVLRITEPQPQFGRVIVADYLPAGFEIDNPRLVSSGDAGTLSWIQDAAAPVNAEFRDDRFSAAFNRRSGDPSVFTVAYIVRAVSPGTYVHPQAFVEDMYRPDRYGRTGSGTVEVTAATAGR